MKLKITLLFIVFISTFSIAQTKVGTIDSDYIINSMPEAKIVVEMTKVYGSKLDSLFNIKLKDFKKRIADYELKEKNMGVLEKKTIQQELSTLEQDLSKFRENGNKLVGLKRDELMRPLYKKLNVAISIISKENEYTQILTTTGNQFAYIDSKFDITNLVIKNLGITISKTKK